MTRSRNIKLRPHIKTHKSVYFAHRQLAHGAAGIAVAKLGEAEVMINGGVTDILLAYPPIGTTKLRRLGRLMQRADITVSIDSEASARGVSKLAEELGQTIRLYLDCDTGLHRMGLPAGDPSVRLGEKISRLPGVELIGVMSHCGQIGRSSTQEELAAGARGDAEALVRTAEGLRERGVQIREVSPGSTPASVYNVDVEGVTEIRPGTYIFNDVNTIHTGTIRNDDCAVSILTTVVSRPAPDRAVVDAGSKTLATDKCHHREGFGMVKGRPNVIVESLSEEHGVLRLDEAAGRELKVGDRIEIIPNHVCPTINLSDTVHLVRGATWLGELPVDARGKRT